MEYLLILIVYLIGSGFHVMQTIAALRKKFPALTPNQVMKTFIQEEWNTLIVSFLLLTLLETTHFIVEYYKVNHTGWLANWYARPAIVLVMGYAGQKIIYKWLGSAQGALERQSDRITERSQTTETVDTPTRTTTITTDTEKKPKIE